MYYRTYTCRRKQHGPAHQDISRNKPLEAAYRSHHLHASTDIHKPAALKQMCRGLLRISPSMIQERIILDNNHLQ